VPKKKRARPDLAGGPFVSGKEISVDRESWSLHRRVNFRHLPLLCGLPLTAAATTAAVRASASTAASTLRYSHLRHWARSRNVRRRIAAARCGISSWRRSTRARATDCKNAAAKSWRYCNSARFRRTLRRLIRPRLRRAAVAVIRRVFRQSAAAAHTTARYWKSLGGCCCSLAQKAARPGHVTAPDCEFPRAQGGRFASARAVCVGSFAGRFEFPKPAGAWPRSLHCLALPRYVAIAGALRRTIPHDRNGRAVRVGHRRRRPILREDPLTAASAGIVGRAARAVCYSSRVCCPGDCLHQARRYRDDYSSIGVLCVGIFLSAHTLIHAAVHRSISRAAGSEARAIDGVNAHLGSPLCWSGASDHGAVLNRSRRPGDVRPHVHGAEFAMLRRSDADRVGPHERRAAKRP